MMEKQLHPIKRINGRFLTAPDSFILKNRSAWNGVSANHLFVPMAEEFSVSVNALAIATHFGSPLDLDWQWGDDKRHLGHPIRLGSCHIQPAGVPHWSRWFEKDAGDMLVVLLEPAFLHRVAQEVVDTDQIRLIGRFGVDDPMLQSFGQLFQAEVDSEGVCGQLYAESLATALALHLYRHYSNIAKPIEQPLGGLSTNQLRLVTDYINTHLDQDISLLELAQLVQMSGSNFARLFKRSLGNTPYQYLTQCRINAAKRLLAQPDIAISDIHRQVGFYDQSRFTNLFRKYVGLTPKKYRDGL